MIFEINLNSTHELVRACVHTYTHTHGWFGNENRKTQGKPLL